MDSDREGINPLTYQISRKSHALESSFADPDRSLLSKLISRDSIPVSIMVSTDKVHSVFCMKLLHLQEILSEISRVLSMACKKKVLHHAFEGQLLQVDVTLSLCTFKLVDKECWKKEVVNPMFASGM